MTRAARPLPPKSLRALEGLPVFLVEAGMVLAKSLRNAIRARVWLGYR